MAIKQILFLLLFPLFLISKEMKDFLPSASLIFDVGAHEGNKTDHYLRLGAKQVICVEPQTRCVEFLQRKFAYQPRVRIEPVALSSQEGTIPFYISSSSTISTADLDWQKGRFLGLHWDPAIEIPATTLDALIEKYGMPDFCKIDVEGYEWNVLSGMTHPIPYLSFEFTEEYLEKKTKPCLEYLAQLGYKSFNVCFGESETFTSNRWMDWRALLREIRKNPDPLYWGDIYAHHTSIKASPPQKIPSELYFEFTLNGQIPVNSWYCDDSYPPEKPLIFKVDEIDGWIEKAKRRETAYYGATDTYLYALLDKYPIEGKNVAIVGTTIPWYESIVLAYGGHPTTIEYNKIVSEDPRIEVMTVDEYEEQPRLFDVILSISSIEHDGLGRYGDPINPRGDLEAMRKMKGMLKEGGVLFLCIPIGQDAIYWNAHRRYGKIRLPMLLEGWDLVDTEGLTEKDFQIRIYNGHQPLFLLRPSS